MYLGREWKVFFESTRKTLNKVYVESAEGNSTLCAVNCEKTLELLLELVVPDSEQFNLQQSFAIETAEVAFGERAFLQHSGRLVYAQVVLLSFAPAPIAVLINVEIRTETENHFRI